MAKNFREIFAELVPGGRGELVMQKRLRVEAAAEAAEDDEDGAEGGHNVSEKYSGVKVKVGDCCAPENCADCLVAFLCCDSRIVQFVCSSSETVQTIALCLCCRRLKRPCYTQSLIMLFTHERVKTLR